MSWNYRIVRTKDNTCRNRWFYEVCEVYYNENGEPWGHCQAVIAGESLKELFEEICPIAMGMAKAYLTYPNDFMKPDFEIPNQVKTTKAKQKPRRNNHVQT